MARGRGGSGGGGSSGSSVCKFGDAPCHFTITELYGHVYTSLFSKGELYGQLIVYIIWSLVLIGLLYTSLRTKARLFQAAVTLFLANFIFLCVRFGLLLGEIDVPVGYRYEISIVVLLQRLGAIFLFAAVFAALRPKKVSGILGWPLILIYAALSIAYLILDFLVSADAMETYKEEGVWSIGDHDFGLTMTPNQITGLKTTALGGDDGLSPFYIKRRVYDGDDELFTNHRSIQIKIGVAMDFVAIFLSLLLTFLSCFSWIWTRKNEHPVVETVSHQNSLCASFPSTNLPQLLLLLADAGLFIYSVFRTIVSTHFILHNWPVITDQSKWIAFIAQYPNIDFLKKIIIPEGFLKGYRTTVNGFPVVQAVLEFLGVIIACTAITYLLVLRRRETLRVTGGQYIK